MKKIVIFLLFGLIGCNDYTEYINKGDEIIYKLENDSLFLQSVTNGNYLYKKWTNEESVFLMYSSEDLSVYKEIIEGESGDYKNIHIQYYNKKGQLVGYKRISSFFNTHCYNDFLKEISIYSVRGLKLKKKFHQIYSLDGSIITDTIGCEFNYRFNYPIHYIFLFPQTDSLMKINTLLLKADNSESLEYDEMYEILDSYKNTQWKNNVELGELRTDAINSILLSPDNLNLLLKILSKKTEILEMVVSDILPVYETKNDSVYHYIHQQKGYDEIKIKFLEALKAGPQR